MPNGITTIKVELPAELHDAVKELAYRKQQSRNQFIVEGVKDKVEKESRLVVA